MGKKINPPLSPQQKNIKNYFFLRIKAFIIDMFMIYTPILYIVTYIILGSKEALWQNQFAIFICWFLYACIDSLFCAIASQTPGMKAQNIILVDIHGNKIGFFKCFLRFFVWLSSLGLGFGFVFPFFRKDRSTFQDWMCQTKIIALHSSEKK